MEETHSFRDMAEISPETLSVLDSLGFKQATPVQEATIPLFCGHKDVAVDACTGSGKTLAFVLPITEKLRKLEEPLKKHQVGAVVVSPTRELARQIFTVLQPFAASIPGVSTMLLTGGSDPQADVAAFQEQGGNILVGTPGRLSDIFERSQVLDARKLEVLVLDEADRLLDAGYGKHLESLMRRLPKQRRTGLFSATQTEAVQALARAGLRNQIRVNVAVEPMASSSGRDAGQPTAGSPGVKKKKAAMPDQRTPAGLEASYLICQSDEKLAQLLQFLKEHREEKIIVYFLTCAAVDFYALTLPIAAGKDGVQASALHGKMKQSQREATLAAFTANPGGVLLCTDVAARGLDIPDVAWIVQFDPPQDPDVFVHRVGRTARMGRSGHALTLLLPHESAYVDFLRIRKVPLKEQKASGGLPNPLPRVKHAAEQDRNIMEKGTRAFVAYVRGYREHQCNFIFRAQELDLGRLATAFALLRLPGMPELARMHSLPNFTPSPVDPNTVKFKDKAREKERQKRIAARALMPKAASLSTAEKKQAKQAELAKEKRRLPAAKRRQQESRQDADDFAAEYRMLRKVKKGKMSEDAFFKEALGLHRDIAEEEGSPDKAADAKPTKDKKQDFKKKRGMGNKARLRP